MKMQLNFKLWNFFYIFSFFIFMMIINQNASTTTMANANIFYINNDESIRINESTEIGSQHRKQLSRQRRYIAFPDGASFSVAICATIGVIGNPNPAYLSYGLNWGVAYDLPNQTWVIDHVNGFRNKNHYRQQRAIIKRQSRRNFYKYIETAIDNIGYNGRHCILRALCESKKYFFKKGTIMIEEIIRIMFSFPKNQVYSHEHFDIFEYDKAFRNGNIVENCGQTYSKCGFSLIDLAFGRYSEPPPDYWESN